MDQVAQPEHCDMNAAAALFVLALYSNDVQTGRAVRWDTQVKVDTAACAQHVGANAAASGHDHLADFDSVGSSSSVGLCLRIIRGLPLTPGIPSLLPAGSRKISLYFLPPSNSIVFLNRKESYTVQMT
jgi:hypothetical protein